MPWFKKADNKGRLELANRLYRVVADPDGRRYEISATNVSTEIAGGYLFSLFFILRAILRHSRGQSWEITVREAGHAHRLVTTEYAADTATAEATVAELAGIITSEGADNLHHVGHTPGEAPRPDD